MNEPDPLDERLIELHHAMPFGYWMTYADAAEAVGAVGGARAVGKVASSLSWTHGLDLRLAKAGGITAWTAFDRSQPNFAERRPLIMAEYERMGLSGEPHTAAKAWPASRRLRVDQAHALLRGASPASVVVPVG
jgi:alkylated DNA nucleotide flippase Atl1